MMFCWITKRLVALQILVYAPTKQNCDLVNTFYFAINMFYVERYKI